MIDGEKRIIVKAYHGPESQQYHGRDIERFDMLWKKVTEHRLGFGFQDPERFQGYEFETFDSLLTEHIEQALERKRDELVILDIGSGDAGIFYDFLTNAETCPRAKSLLSQNKQLHIRMLGVTDAQSKDLFMDKKVVDGSSDQITAENYQYTLTRNQRLRDFFSQVGSPKIDIAISAWTLPYLASPVLEEVIRDVVDSLNDGGRFVGLMFAETPPGFMRVDSGRPQLITLSNEGASNTFKSLIRDPEGFFLDRSKGLNDKLESFRRLLKKLGQVEADSRVDVKPRRPESIFDRIAQLEEQKTREREVPVDIRIDEIISSDSDEDEKLGKLASLAKSAVEEAQRRVFSNKYKAGQKKRSSMLEYMKQDFGKKVVMIFDEKYIGISKPIKEN